MSRDLAAVRAELAERQQRAAAVDAASRAADQAWSGRAARGATQRELHLRCEHGDRTLLAKVFDAPEGVLFSSRIPWRPSDQLTLPAWEREHFLAQPGLADWPDDQLESWLDELEALERGKPADGPRWLLRAGRREVHDVLDLPPGPSGWLPGLWVRCERHPKSAQAYDRRALVTAARRAVPPPARR